jgi:hypothetical protein
MFIFKSRMDVFDILLPPIYFIIIFALARKYSSIKRKQDEAYHYFVPGLVAKMFGAIALGLVYYFYYGGGDTVNYFDTACAFVEVLVDNPGDFSHLYFGSPHHSEYYLLCRDKEFVYWTRDAYAFFVSKCYVPIVLISGKCYTASAILTAALCYLPVWRLFLIFNKEFPVLRKQIAWAVLFIPSVVFWGGGIMKDSITFSATCLYVHGFYWFFTQRKLKLVYLGALFFAAYLLLMIKPYILVALIPGSVLWFTTMRASKIKSAFVRTVIIPVFLVLGFILTTYLLSQMDEVLGRYSVDKVLYTASNAQQDLKQSYYMGNSFDIGNYEPTFAGALSVAHKAIFAALFRPTILDVKNIVMLLSALENTFILLLCIYLLLKLRVIHFFTHVSSHPLLLFSFIFSILFALSVGLSIANFGTLVRLKIPSMPFFVCTLIIINFKSNLSKSERERTKAALPEIPK